MGDLKGQVGIMIGHYVRLVFWRAAQLVWKALVNYPVPALIGIIVYYPIVYFLTWRASQGAPNQSRWADAVLDLHTAAEAFAWSVAIVFILAVLVLAPYQLWKEAQEKGASANSTLAQIGEARPLLFMGFRLGWDWFEDGEDEGPAITSVTFIHENRGPWTLVYNVENPWVQVGSGERMPLKVIKRDTLTAPSTAGIFLMQLPHPVRVKDFPIFVEANIDYVYDTRPPTRQRRHGATVRNLIHGWSEESKVEGMFFIDQRED